MQDNLYTSSFKDIVKFILKVIFFIIILIPMIGYIGTKYSKASTENVINKFNEKRFEDFYNLPKDSLDIAFVGSSHSYCTFDPNIFDDNLGTSSFQMGMPLQYPDSTYYTIKEIINYQKPKLIVMEIYWDLLKNDFELNQAKTLFQVLKNEDLKDEYIKNVFPLSEKIKYNTNILKYQADYFAFKGNKLKNRIKNKLGVVDRYKAKQDGIEEYRSKGYTYSTYKMLDDEYDKTNQFKGLDGKDFEISNNQKEHILNIIKLCRENGIKLMFVTAPIANVSMDYIKNYSYINKKIGRFAQENNIPYIDYNIINKKEKLLTNENFRDDAHLNHSGVEIVSKHFINLLKNRGDLTKINIQ